jgi:hypothetical protein
VSVDNVKFTWFNPSNVPVEIEIVPLSLSGQAESSFEPDEVGDWTVEAAFNDVAVERQTVSVLFMVIPESPIGIVALLGSSLAAMGGFILLRRRSANRHNGSVGDLGI